jgi:hypothetical protein
LYFHGHSDSNAHSKIDVKSKKKKNVSSLAIGMSHLDFIFYDDHA